MVWISIPESMHYFNQFVYAGCAAKSVKPEPESELWLGDSEPGSQSVFWKATPSLSTKHDFQPISQEIFFWTQSQYLDLETKVSVFNLRMYYLK